jgi:hypothetical protein
MHALHGRVTVQYKVEYVTHPLMNQQEAEFDGIIGLLDLVNA